MLCYKQVEYSVFSASSSHLNMEKLFSKIFKKYKRKIKIFEKIFLKYFLRYFLRRRRLILRRSVESRSPLDEFFNVLQNFASKVSICTYLEFKLRKKIDNKKNRFQSAEAP